MFDSSSYVNPTPLAHTDTSRDVFPRGAQPNMVEVKLTNEGKGYGLVIGFLNPPPDDEPLVPRITAVSAQGAAFKVGTLLKGDRVWSINGQNTIGLTANRLERLTEEAFRADQITLTIEFDVVERDIKYGTFDVCINKTSKIGLVFHEFNANSPMVVKGIVKGSAAHRSGLLFPGDEILYTSCIRQETYDVLGGAYEKTDTVVMTVKRDFLQDKHDEEMSPNSNSQSFEKLPSFPPVSKTFSLTSTSIHSDHETNSTVLEHELTLFRDPNSADFGFLIQQNIETGEVFVSDIKPGGPADCSRVIKKNDRILEVCIAKIRF
ncbi:glutamate receptor-interacting protein 2 [Trichonephila clavipes]|nr:glutamate receptor-interacting protein 2 [Trichonephila clavipes]